MHWLIKLLIVLLLGVASNLKGQVKDIRKYSLTSNKYNNKDSKGKKQGVWIYDWQKDSIHIKNTYLAIGVSIEKIDTYLIRDMIYKFQFCDDSLIGIQEGFDRLMNDLRLKSYYNIERGERCIITRWSNGLLRSREEKKSNTRLFYTSKGEYIKEILFPNDIYMTFIDTTLGKTIVYGMVKNVSLNAHHYSQLRKDKQGNYLESMSKLTNTLYLESRRNIYYDQNKLLIKEIHYFNNEKSVDFEDEIKIKSEYYNKNQILVKEEYFDNSNTLYKSRKFNSKGVLINTKYFNKRRS
jgi:hypothetical protein